ncbi:MAG: hypothetical protein SAJ12_17915 [Jaaginema sp. PMC 1079.18]|nr:hypothetical protein [Jaaginema sp. PMC 1080.18]MEC4852860.1 hypothetical protein [Jaaginema sp. PMC 1079.18]MEC4867672.1 hypothetical protein [Jaaginema sp. PMC 1078.18]
MFNHFRHYYPQGNLISQFITVDRGQFIVRVVASVDNITIASSLAAAPSIEQAEDKARERLFALLDIPHSTPTAIAETVPLPQSPSNTPLASPPPPQPEIAVSPPPPPQPEIAVSPPPPPPSSQPEVAVNSSPPDPTPIVSENFDFDEAIHQTDIQLKRLGWSHEQGRDYLQNTYGVDIKSRKQLTSAQINAFLAYLRAQPSPSVPETPPAPTDSQNVMPPEIPTATAVVDPNFNFPEAMRQINGEKKRLGWTKDREKEYLRQTYGRLSLQHLPDAQLAEYLEYLQNLPSPG